MSGSPVRGILFDAGNTLLHVHRDRLLGAIRSEGVPASGANFPEVEFEARMRLTERVLAEGTGTEDHIWREYFVTLFRGLGVPDDRLAAVGARVKKMHRRAHLWTYVQPGTREALSLLRDRGYPMGVVSNSDGRVEELLEGTGLRPFFRVVVDSEVVGVEKPDPRIFLLGAEGIGVEPEACLYVGDLYPVDVVGARRAGMRAVLVDPLGRQARPCDAIPSVAALPAYLEALGGGGASGAPAGGAQAASGER